MKWNEVAAIHPEFVQWVVQKFGPLPDGPVVEADYERFRAAFEGKTSPIVPSKPRPFPASISNPCMICGDPGAIIPAPLDFPSITDDAPDAELSPMHTANACYRHLRYVRMYLEETYAPRRAAYREGRP